MTHSNLTPARRAFAAIAIGCIGVAFTASGEPAAKAVDQHDDAKAAIRKLLEDQEKAWNKRDLAGFMNGYWRSDKLTFSSGKDTVKGWDATLDRYRKRYQTEGKEMGKLSFSELEIDVLAAEAAWVRGRWKLQQSNQTLEGLFTLIVKKHRDGWHIVHDHTSS